MADDISKPAAGPAVWLDMDQAALDDAYDQSVWAPNQKAVHARRSAASEEAYGRLKPARFAYGETAIEGFDFYSCGKPGAGIVIFVHGGAWRSGAARNFAHLAETFVSFGLNCAVLDFINIDEAKGDLMKMAAQARSAVAWIYKNAASLDSDASRIFIAGQSSGAHLGGCIIATGWQKDFGLPAQVLKGAILLSGMYDLTPVALSKRSEYVRFTPQIIESLSAIRHIERIHCPVVLGYGTHESPEFQRQTPAFAAALQKAGKPCKMLIAEGANHFEMVEALHNPLGIFGRAARTLMSAD